MAMGCRQCLPLSVVQLKDKHCRKPYCRNGVVDTFRPRYLFLILFPIAGAEFKVYVHTPLPCSFKVLPSFVAYIIIKLVCGGYGAD